MSAPVRIEAIGPHTKRVTAPALISHHGTCALGEARATDALYVARVD